MTKTRLAVYGYLEQQIQRIEKRIAWQLKKLDDPQSFYEEHHRQWNGGQSVAEGIEDSRREIESLKSMIREIEELEGGN
jgi:hypothetical protein